MAIVCIDSSVVFSKAPRVIDNLNSQRGAVWRFGTLSDNPAALLGLVAATGEEKPRCRGKRGFWLWCGEDQKKRLISATTLSSSSPAACASDRRAYR